VRIHAALLPRDKPRYLMGVGTPLDILEAVHRGVDMFDCIIPTQVAQRGGAFTSRGFLQMRRGVYKVLRAKLDPHCRCPDRAPGYSRAYLHHLTKTEEVLGWQAARPAQHPFLSMSSCAIGGRAFIEDRFTRVRTGKARLSWDAADRRQSGGSARIHAKSKHLLGDYEVHTAREGFASIRQISSGEIMHSARRRWTKRRALSVEQLEPAAAPAARSRRVAR
jgi:queuine tRNA-ribosyltransferase